jgi:hypothetical protein
MATATVADYLLRRLREWGVDKVFGFPGDGINGILAAWGRAENNPISRRHEGDERSRHWLREVHRQLRRLHRHFDFAPCTCSMACMTPNSTRSPCRDRER